MTVHLSSVTATNVANTIWAAVDAGGAAGYLQFWSGYLPVSPDTPIDLTQSVLLSTVYFSYPSFSAAVGGVITANAFVTDPSAAATGIPIFARAFTSTGNVVFDCDVGPQGGTAQIQMAPWQITAGGTNAVTGFVLAVPTTQ